jgi:hypothetical protein
MTKEKKVDELIEYYDLTTTRQTRDIVYKRYFLYHYLRENTGLTLFAIADKFKRKGSQRHANILNGIGQSIIEEVLLCSNYWEMVKLQNKYKNITQLE